MPNNTFFHFKFCQSRKNSLWLNTTNSPPISIPSSVHGKNLDTWENSFYEIATVSFFSLEPVGLWLQLAFEIGGNNVLFDFLSCNILFAAVVRKWKQKI